MRPLIDALDRADGDVDLEVEHHEGEPLFPGHPFYAMRYGDPGDNGAGSPEDAEPDDKPEDDDPDEWSAICIGRTKTGRLRWS